MPPHMHGNVKSLYLLVKNVLIKHVDSIEDIGDLDYTLVRPVLLKITSPVQLKKLEANCPQIRGEDSEIWKILIGKHFGQDALHKMELQGPKNWRKAYDKLQKAADEAAAAATETLRAQMTKMSSAKQQSRAKILTSTVGLPSTGRPRSFGGGGGWGGTGNSWTVKAGSKTKNIIDKARREAKELSVFRGRNSVLAAPTHTLKRQEVDRKMREKIMKKMGDAKGKGKEGDGEEEEAEASRRRNDNINNNKRGRDDPASGGDDRGPKRISGADGGKTSVPSIGRNMPGNNGKVTSSLPPAPTSAANMHLSRRAPTDPFLRRKR
ncbi:RNA polymerase II transcription factor SIII subunit A-domain-containing protein [Tuber borchii]|uniref:RNA polymerase II transcription factor SIII subunit A-domain-containing protein n=1 Tax=Tuber borchii TaxID=42251 RepID=A0A2T6ZM58_TUBBO|nr:RNA polymerase II transcription factor SIII subunit A-domain-containing protein [Tuber borchii]